MGLFKKQEDFYGGSALYTLGLNRTIIIVGLGNPGKEYDGTRHNIGFECLDYLAKKQDFDPWMDKKDLKCLLTSKTLGSSRVILAKPTTFMNLSGEAVQAVAHFYKVATGQITVVHDELDIPFGQIRTRTGGSSAGHNGLKSIIQNCGEDFSRIRIGIGPKTPEQMDTADFVLTKFTKDQQDEIDGLKREVTALLTEYIHGQNLPSETRNFLL